MNVSLPSSEEHVLTATQPRLLILLCCMRSHLLILLCCMTAKRMCNLPAKPDRGDARPPCKACVPILGLPTEGSHCARKAAVKRRSGHVLRVDIGWC